MHILTGLKAVEIIRRAFADISCIFRAVTLLEPPKKDMIAFLDLEHGSSGAANPAPPRIAMVHAHIENVFRELHVNLDQRAVVSDTALPGRHSHIDSEFMHRVELACLAHPEVQRQVKALNLPGEATVVVEPWTYGPDGMNDMSKRLTMVPTPAPQVRFTALYLVSNCSQVLVLHAYVV